MINIYPSKLDCNPIETYRLKQPDTIHGWMKNNVSTYEPRKIPPVSITVNGNLIHPSQWESVGINPLDTVDIYVEPKGLDPFTWVLIAAVALSVASALYAIGNMPKMSGSSAALKGNAIDIATAKGNQVKLNSIIREIAGTFKVYPDYLLPPHSYYLDGTNQWIEMLLCVGKGSYIIPDETVLIGDTTMSSLGVDAEYTIYEPNADITADTSSEWWHSAPEVAGTSNGKTGLELNATYVIGSASTASAYSFDGLVVKIPLGAGEFPNWPISSIITIELFQNYDVTEGWSDRDIISGDFTTLDPFVGMLIEITGPNEGDYIINSYEVDSDGIGYITLNYNNGSQVNGLTIGNQRMSIGYRDQRYRITSMITNSYDIDETPEVEGFVYLRDEMHVVRLTDEGVDDVSWLGFSFVIVNDAIIAIDATDQEGEWAGPFSICPIGETSDIIEYDLMFPGGIGRIENSGAVTPLTVRTELQWREIGGSTWNSVIKDTTGSTLDQLGYTETVNLGSNIRAEVRMRRIGAKSTLTNVQDNVQWYSLKTKLNAPSSYSGVTTISVKIRGGGQISAQSDQMISVQATRKLPVRVDGEWTSETETRSIVPWVCYIAKSMGYTDDDLSLVDFDTLGALWDSRGDYYDMSVESDGTVKGEMLNALRAGFSEFTLDRGVIKPIRDEVRTVYEHMYTPQNMTEQLTRSFQTIRPDESDGVDVEYVDGVSWTKETVECRLSGDAGTKVEKITVEGVTDRTKAWRIGMRQRRMQKYRRWAYKFATEMDALNSSYMSFCAVGDDVPGYSQSSILLGYTLMPGYVLLQSSEPFTFVDEVSHVVGIRRPDGTLSGPYVATRVSEKVISIPDIDFTPDVSWDIEPPHLIFGTVNKWSYPVLISSVSHNGESKVDVEAVNYDVRIYSDDDNTP